jgi:hypothetical protein
VFRICDILSRNRILGYVYVQWITDPHLDPVRVPSSVVVYLRVQGDVVVYLRVPGSVVVYLRVPGSVGCT